MGLKRPVSDRDVIPKRRRFPCPPDRKDDIELVSKTVNSTSETVAETVAKTDGKADIDDLEEGCNAPESQSSRFLDLPVELRWKVYHHCLPRQKRVIVGDPNDKPVMKDDAKADKSDQEYIKPQLSLFLVNKFVRNEARGILYGENTFEFTIDATAHQPVSLRSPKIFGPFGSRERLPLLRELRKVHLNVVLTGWGHWAAQRHRSRLEYFISVLKEHSDNDNQRSLLERLTVSFSVQLQGWDVSLAHRSGSLEKTVFALEPLTSFRGIGEVEIAGKVVPEWFASCLKLCVEGKGSDVLPPVYPKTWVTRKRCTKGWTRRYKTTTVMKTTKQWHHSALNWSEFAHRNGIEMPDRALWP